MSNSKNNSEDSKSQNDEEYDPQVEIVGNWKICDLPQIPTITGEQEENIILQIKSKVYRWRGEWKQRGIGQLKILKHQKTGLIRILMRAQKTHKCIVNHLLQQNNSLCQLIELKTNNNAWIWIGYDISDNEARGQKFCARFTCKEHFIKFKEQFQKACEQNQKILNKKQQLQKTNKISNNQNKKIQDKQQ